MSIEELIIRLSRDPFNPMLNFDVAVEYERLNQTASAVSFYLRAVEFGPHSNDVRVYASLCKMAHCFDDQNDRAATVSNCLLQAIAHMPNRPEAYFLLSQFHERAQQWQEAYTFAEIGLQYDTAHELPVNVGYKGRFSLEFQKAVSAYWVGRPKESKEILLRLSNMALPAEYTKAIAENLGRLNAVL